MDNITISLKNPRKDSPWGLFVSDDPRSIPKVWLTEDKPQQKVSRNLLTEDEILTIRTFHYAGVLEVEGIEESSSKDYLWDLVVEEEVKESPSKQEMADVVALFEREEEILELLDSQNSNPVEEEEKEEAKKIVSLPAQKCRKKLKLLEKEEEGFSILEKCLSLEEKGKKRKTILALIRKLMIKNISVRETDKISISGRQTSLSNAYYKTIEWNPSDDSEQN